MVLLNRTVGKEYVPAGVRFSFKLTEGRIKLLVYGLDDRYVRGGAAEPEMTLAAMTLHGGGLPHLLNEFTRTNPADPSDVRFRAKVVLLSEDQQKYSLFPPGEVWIPSHSDYLDMPRP
jgi:hypothetical protein